MSANEGVPLTSQYLLEALRAASSASQELVKEATDQLQKWGSANGYWVLLQVYTIAGVRDASMDLSLMERHCAGCLP